MTKDTEELDITILKELTLLYVEDDQALRKQMLEYLRMIFDCVYTAENGAKGIEAYRKFKPQLIVTDIKMPVMDGLEMTAQIKQESPDTPIIITTAFSETEYLIRAIEIGVDRYVRKPLEEDLLLEALYKCGLPLVQENSINLLQETLDKSLLNKLGHSTQMQALSKQILRVAATGFSVVLQGETGTGKSMAARLIHDLSPRADEPFIIVDVGSIPETLVERELFGHKKGAFTGADKDKAGLLETANRGTIFLDELENMSPQVQSKLLRAVDEKEICPIGGTQPMKIDVRIISASNTRLEEIREQGKFREDLYYRLCEFDIHIPPLRERSVDIPLLARRFITETVQQINRETVSLSEDAEEFLQKQQWPGNVRQVKNILRRAVLFCETTIITTTGITAVFNSEPKNENKTVETIPTSIPSSLALDDVEKWAVEQALLQAGGKRMKAASLLKIDYKRLIRKMGKYAIVAADE
ncbi:MAG: sigma-54-dependent Fis family transcriptional regulator [bacterium]|nr:sigma-54-dependent Fis family transcriptional regulator [bacterium]